MVYAGRELEWRRTDSPNTTRQCREVQGDLHNGAQRINPENRVGSSFRIIPEQYFSGVENIDDFLVNIDHNLAYHEIPAQLACAYLKGHLKGRALDWFEVLGYRVIEDKTTDYVHLKQALSEQFPVVRNRSELETRFYSSSQRRDQQPSDFIYELLKIHKVLKLEMSEEKLIDHVVSRLEPQILDYVEGFGEVNGNNLIIWKSGRKTTVNIDQVRVYRPPQTDTISSDSPVETLYDEQEVSHGSNRSNQGQFKERRKTSSQESEGCRSRQGNTAREIPRNKRKLSQYESKDQVLKRSKMCRKRSLQGSEHQDRKRRAPEQRQGVKRSIPFSISSRTYKFKRPNTSSPGVESIAGPSRLPDRRRSASTTVGSRTEGSGRDNQTRQTRATTRGRNKQAERPVRSNQAHTRRPCPYYLRSRVKESDGIPEQRNIEINGIPHNRIRRSLSMEALDGDPVHRRI
ncbi:uncharacterized protein TNCV_4912341 [Trichonephila clavipes]|nr:uncharacterized protein TNCV_4912341 [Trichonephila clavipes]